MRKIKTIIIHCADTPTGRETTVEDIDSWHVERGFKRVEANRVKFNPQLKAIGYHFVIYVDGTIHTGRNVEEVGAHCSGLNSNSIGVCLVGNSTFNQNQWDALAELIRLLQNTYSQTTVIGHRDTPSGSAQGKSCPGFNVAGWFATLAKA